MNGIRQPVLVVDDSPVQRRFLRAVLDADPRLTVVAEARNGKEAVAMVERLRPAAVVMDLDLPVMNGIEAIERIMAVRPTPIVVCSGYVGGEGLANAAAATAAGAVDVVKKPTPEDGPLLEQYAAELRRRVLVATRVRVITHPRGRLRRNVPLAGVPGGARSATIRALRADVAQQVEPDARVAADLRRPDDETAVQLVVIGASTGGPHALAAVLGSLPADFPVPICVVQHMAEGFVEGLAQWLDESCRLPVGVATHGQILQPGGVTLAPSARNLVIGDRLRVRLEEPPPSQFHVPGIDVTFTSAAQAVGGAAIGVLLTGMGRDGAAGLRVLREAGAHTIGQDEATSAVYGMPGAARALDAVVEELPLHAIAPAVVAAMAPAPLPEAAP